MPNIHVKPAEKNALISYIQQPWEYISEEYQVYFPEGVCPENTKITRVLRDEAFPNRYFIVPVNEGAPTHTLVPFQYYEEGDSLEHGCTFVGGKYFFHQNENDLPKIRKNITQSVFSDSDTDSEEEKDHVAKMMPEQIEQRNKERSRFKAHFQKIREERSYEKNYLKNHLDNGLIKDTVKFAVDENDRDYILKSTSSLVEAYVPLPQIPVDQTHQFRLYRSTKVDGGTRSKRVDITPFYGPNLLQWINTQEVSEDKMNHIVHEILAQYIQQIHQANLVHTDINPRNICIELVDDAVRIQFIDFNEAFLMDTEPSKRKGKGTVEYYAPEFFLDNKAYLRQLEIRDEGERALIDALKPDFRSVFSPATDIYALGHTILEDLSLSENSPYYDLVHRMCDENPDARPTGNDIQHELELITSLQAESRKTPG